MDTQLSEVYGAPRQTKSTVFAYFEEALLSNPDGTAVIVMHQPATHLSSLINSSIGDGTRSELYTSDTSIDCLKMTFNQLHSISARFSTALFNAGVQSHTSKIVTFIPNGVEFSIMIWASLLARIALSTLDAGALSGGREKELGTILTELNPDVVLVADDDACAVLDRMYDNLGLKQPRAKIILSPMVSDASSHQNWHSFVNFISSVTPPTASQDTELRALACNDDSDRICSVLFTSGTSSGKPKGCERSLGQLTQVVPGYRFLASSGSKSRMLIQTANFRITALVAAMEAWISAGAIVMASATWNPEVVLRAISLHHITSMLLVPYHLHTLVADPHFPSTDLSSVQVVSLGGDMVTQAMLQQCRRAFPDAKSIIVSWGMTEGGGIVEWSYDTTFDSIPYYGGIAPLGKVATGTKLRVVDEVTRQPTRRGIPGELHVSSGGFIDNYLGGLKKEDFYHDGDEKWFNTGDLGMIDAEDNIYVLGRIKDVIKRAGVPITPAALENCILTNTKTECSVIGIPHPTMGAEPFAVVRDFKSANETQIMEFVLKEFGKDYALNGVACLDQLGLSQFPYNATGKVMKIELVDLVVRFLQSR